jgi:hypothetical protein
VGDGALRRLLVVGYGRRHEGKPEEHVIYSVVVLREGHDDEQLYKRYSEFCKLQERIEAASRTLNKQFVPPLPPKLLVGANERAVLVERVAGLQNFVDLCMLQPAYRPVLDEWVRANTKSRTTRFGTLGRKSKKDRGVRSRASMRVVDVCVVCLFGRVGTHLSYRLVGIL